MSRKQTFVNCECLEIGSCKTDCVFETPQASRKLARQRSILCSILDSRCLAPSNRSPSENNFRRNAKMPKRRDTKAKLNTPVYRKDAAQSAANVIVKTPRRRNAVTLKLVSHTQRVRRFWQVRKKRSARLQAHSPVPCLLRQPRCRWKGTWPWSVRIPLQLVSAPFLCCRARPGATALDHAILACVPQTTCFAATSSLEIRTGLRVDAAAARPTAVAAKPRSACRSSHNRPRPSRRRGCLVEFPRRTP